MAYGFKPLPKVISIAEDKSNLPTTPPVIVKLLS